MREFSSLFDFDSGAPDSIVRALNLDIVLIFLLAAVVIVPVARRLRSSPVLGYLAAGLLIGPNALGLVGNLHTVQLIAELGVVFLLFTIGLEMSWQRLRALRRAVLGMGGVQLLVCGGAVYAITWWITQDLRQSIVIAGALALSSTAFAMHMLNERDEAATRHGRAAFGILLMQDLAVVPLLALIPVMGMGGGSVGWSVLAGLGIGVFGVGLIILLGIRVLRPIYRYVAHAHSPELFTATTLLLVLGMGVLTYLAGLSMALGGFVAGLILAETEYRHQIEAEIEPFRGLLLGLFFISIGMAMEVPLLKDHFFTLLGIVAGLLLLKTILIGLVSLAFRLDLRDALRVALLLAPGGEFAFLLFGVAGQFGVIAVTTSQILMLAVTLSMVASPFLLAWGDRLIKQRLSAQPTQAVAALETNKERHSGHVIIAGYGRVGQNVARLLEADGQSYLALDLSANRVERLRARGLPVFYGDASKLEVLKAAGVARAKAVIVTLDKPAHAHRATAVLHRAYPDLPIVVRAHDTHHVRRLKAVGASAVVPATVESSLQLAGIALTLTGTLAADVALLIENFRADGYHGLDTRDSSDDEDRAVGDSSDQTGWVKDA